MSDLDCELSDHVSGIDQSLPGQGCENRVLIPDIRSDCWKSQTLLSGYLFDIFNGGCYGPVSKGAVKCVL